MLHPTLWRTCRILSGPTRLRLLRLVVHEPGLSVTRLAEKTSLKLSRASQELRRLQARGLIQAQRKKGHVYYVPVPDPLVAPAKPLLDALKSAFAGLPPAEDRVLIATATALSDPRRLTIVTELLKGPRHFRELQAGLQIPAISLHRQLHRLNQLGLAGQARRVWGLIPNRHPLTRALLRILRPGKRPAAG